MAMGDPSTESAEVRPTTLSAVTAPETTWYRRTFLSAAGSLSRPSSVPAGRAANAASVGANTVYGPAPSSVSTRPAALTAVSRVLNEPASVAVWTMSLDMAAADADGAAAIDGATVVTALGAALGADPPVDALGDAAVEHAAMAIANAGRSRAMDRFMADDFPSDAWVGSLVASG